MGQPLGVQIPLRPILDREGFEVSLGARRYWANATKAFANSTAEASGRPGVEQAEPPKAVRTCETEGADLPLGTILKPSFESQNS